MFIGCFNPRGPCGPRRAPETTGNLDAMVSIHAARVGRDTMSRGPLVGSMMFQSTRPVWAATSDSEFRCDGCRVSIHAARVGRDAHAQKQPQPQQQFQSTRPVWAATTHSQELPARKKSFNPRGPCGPRLNDASH